MSSAARSASQHLSGPVAVCVDRPLLALDRAFTYEVSAEMRAGVGSLVGVPFHGRTVRGWVLGPTDDVPSRILPIRKMVSDVRFFDEEMLGLFRWISERYVAPLASVIARSHPPRVASEEAAARDDGAGRVGGRFAPSAGLRTPAVSVPAVQSWAPRYSRWEEMVDGVHRGGGTFILRPAPGDQVASAVEIVRAAVERGRSAIVLVPEAEPLPATATVIADAFGDAVAMFLGGDKRTRYRTWLDIARGRYRVVIGTRSAVFAPVTNLGVLFVSREHHTLHREERSPYHHVRDVAVERARRSAAACVLASVCPSLEARALPHVEVAPAGRSWPPVEVVRPGPEGRAPRLVRALAGARRAFVYEPLPGYGVARVCKRCGEAAACATCRGSLRLSRGVIRCTVCGADGRCASCGASTFGVIRGGVERVVEWVSAVARVRVHGSLDGRGAGVASNGETGIAIGGLESVKDSGERGLDLVAVLDADASLRRPGIGAREHTLAAWMEAAAWVRPDGRVILQTDHPNEPAVQALVAGRPERFARSELARLADAGFPVGAPVFRVVGTAELEPALSELGPHTLLATGLEGRTVCLVAIDRGSIARFSRSVRGLAERGVVTRVEAEPHL
jgi:primosomal protein N' (replication factor Y) (superfamily II helicase)